MASVGLHACLAAVLSALPDPPRRRLPLAPLTFELTPATPPPAPAATAPRDEGGTVPARLPPRGGERQPTGRPSSGSRPSSGNGVLGMRGAVGTPGGVNLPSPGEVARGVVQDEPAPPPRPPPSPLDLHVPPAPAVEPPRNPLEGFGRALVDWSKDPYAYQRTLDREEPGRPMLKPVNPLVKPGEPGAREGPMVYIPLAMGTFGGPSRPTRVISDEPVDERDALHRLARRLEAVWGDGTRPAVERRRTLFELWDECQESGAGVVARAQIMGFIRRRLPGSYPAEELQRLNARRTSRERFAP